MAAVNGAPDAPTAAAMAANTSPARPEPATKWRPAPPRGCRTRPRPLRPSRPHAVCPRGAAVAAAASRRPCPQRAVRCPVPPPVPLPPPCRLPPRSSAAAPSPASAPPSAAPPAPQVSGRPAPLPARRHPALVRLGAEGPGPGGCSAAGPGRWRRVLVVTRRRHSRAGRACGLARLASAGPGRCCPRRPGPPAVSPALLHPGGTDCTLGGGAGAGGALPGPPAKVTLTEVAGDLHNRHRGHRRQRASPGPALAFPLSTPVNKKRKKKKPWTVQHMLARAQTPRRRGSRCLCGSISS